MAVQWLRTDQYDGATWQYAHGEKRSRAPSGRKARRLQDRGGQAFEPLVASLVKPPVLRDETLQNPRTVFQIVKRHFARYTPEMVEKATGCPKETFPQGRRDDSGQLRRGPDDVVRLRRGLDAAHLRRPDHRRLRAAAAAARQYGPAGRRRHGAARPRLDPGLDGRSDALPLDPGLHVGADGAQEARHAAGLHRDRD